MTFIDLHTHNGAPAANTIFNSNCYIDGRSISIGIHPWHINNDWQNIFADIATHAKTDNVVAIGECGFDILKSPATAELQEDIFRAHAQLAETLCKPLIIHCVKAFDRLLALYKDMKPQQAWIIHGFRGKPQQAEQLAKAGLYISLGEKFNHESAKAIPAERLFIETDESACSIAEIYRAVAQAKGITAEALAQQTMQNAKRCNIAL